MIGDKELEKKLFDLAVKKKSRYQLDDVKKVYTALRLKLPPLVHIGGTNGKGSCVEKVKGAFENAGYLCGAFTSPHTTSIRERIQINNQLIPKDVFKELLEKIFQLSDSLQVGLTFFEVLTLVALAYFSMQPVDIALIEVGIGGRKDSTNCITPILSVITSISYDHTEILGDTLEEIANEKAGIIKRGVPVIVGPSVVQQVVQQVAKEQKAPLIQVLDHNKCYDAENKAIARAVLNNLQSKWPLNESNILHGLCQKPRARFEVLKYMQHRLILDMGHNSEGLKRLLYQVDKQYSEYPLKVFISMSTGHHYVENIQTLLAHTDQVAALDISHSRLVDAQEIAKYLPGNKAFTIQEAFDEIKETQVETVFVFCGSIFMMQPIYQKLNIDMARDSIRIDDGVFLTKANRQ